MVNEKNSSEARPMLAIYLSQHIFFNKKKI